jgi:hypothetical protein
VRIPEENGIACGGSRAGGGCVQAYPGSDPDGWVDMQGSAYGEAFYERPGILRADWYSTVLVGDVPGVGRAVMRYRDELPSVVDIASISGTDQQFFPARAVQTLHYRITIVDDLGEPVRELTADRPMVMTATINAVPPVDTAFDVAETVTFADDTTGEPVLVLRSGSQGKVLDAQPVALAVEEGVSAFADRVDLSITATPPHGIRALDEANLWWALTSHGVDLDSSPPVLGPVTTEPLRVTGTRSSEHVGMVVVHAFQFGVDEAGLHESHLARRV